jgi:hypothetical protein
MLCAIWSRPLALYLRRNIVPPFAEGNSARLEKGKPFVDGPRFLLMQSPKTP